MNDTITSFIDLIDYLSSCLSCNARESKPNEIILFINVILTASWGAIQNLIPITPPTVSGPGIVDFTFFLSDIGSAESSQEANERAARGLYDRLLPGFGENMMNPLVEKLLNFGRE